MVKNGSGSTEDWHRAHGSESVPKVVMRLDIQPHHDPFA